MAVAIDDDCLVARRRAAPVGMAAAAPLSGEGDTWSKRDGE
jgi:hypothetical protein